MKQKKQRHNLTSRIFYPILRSEVLFKEVFNKALNDINNAVLLDYGCGSKPYKPILEDRLKDYIGLDLPRNPDADLHLTENGGIPLEDSRVDIVLSTQVLEHVTDPIFYLSECRRVLKFDGKLVLSTHGHWKYHPDPTDYWRWTSAGLRKILEDAGFTLLSFRGTMGLASCGIQFVQDAAIKMILRIIPSDRLQDFITKILAVGFQSLSYLVDQFYTQEQRDEEAHVFITLSRKA